MRNIIIFVVILAGLSMASAYDDCQNKMIEGSRLSWQMAAAYAEKDIATFNALADQWNAWVRQNFGEDANLLMSKMAAPTDLTKAVLITNNTTGGIQHKIDGGSLPGASYTTNDMNLLPAKDADDMERMAGYYDDGSPVGGQYLGGV